jgi:branched-subunit amino acid transport protein
LRRRFVLRRRPARHGHRAEEQTRHLQHAGHARPSRTRGTTAGAIPALASTLRDAEAGHPRTPRNLQTISKAAGLFWGTLGPWSPPTLNRAPALPDDLERLLSLAAPAVLAALVASSVFVVGDARRLPVALLPAVLAAVLVVRRTGKPVHALAAGLPLVWVVTALAGP